MVINIPRHDFLADARFAEQDDRRVEGRDAVGHDQGGQRRIILDDHIILGQRGLDMLQFQTEPFDGIVLGLYRFLELVDFRQIAHVRDDHDEITVLVEDGRARDERFLTSLELLLQRDRLSRLQDDE